MTISTGLRGQVERLLRGDVRPSDLHEMFLQLRDGVGGAGIITEVANFMAHSVRTQGSVWHDAKDRMEFLKLKHKLQNSLIITGTLPASIVNILRTNLQQSKKKMLTQLTGMSKRQAEDILEQILKRAIPVSPGRINKFEIRGPNEARVFQFASSYIKGGPLFGENDLFEDFCRALIASGTLLPGEKSLLKSSKAAISIFSLAVMQNSRIELADGEFATFFVVPDIRGNIGGYVVGEMGKRPNGIDTAYLWTMETSLSFEEYCEPAIIPTGRTKVLGDLQLSFSDSGKPLLALKL